MYCHVGAINCVLFCFVVANKIIFGNELIGHSVSYWFSNSESDTCKLGLALTTYDSKTKQLTQSLITGWNEL